MMEDIETEAERRVVVIVIVINNSEMSDSSMESCNSEDDISSSELRPVEVSKEGSGRGIGREKGSGRGRLGALKLLW